MKKYVVTGGAGFIGSALVRGLLALGDGTVEVIDNLSTGREHNLEEVSSQVALHRADIRDFSAISSIIAGADTVFHIAAIPSVPKSIVDPVPSHESNIDGTFNVLRSCVEGKVRKVVYAASSSAYGDTEVLPKVETMQTNPKSPYAAQKLMGEYYCSAFSSCYGLDATSLRFFNVYGPRQDPGSPYSGVISVFMTCVLNHTSPTIHGDGEQTRDFTYIEDVVDLVIKTSKASGVAGKVFNAGNGNRYSLNQIWELVQKIEGVEIPAKYGPSRAGDVRDSQADTTAAVRELGHAPRFSIEEGLRRTLNWYRESLVGAATAAPEGR
ncbi:MAG: SDR family oxidoreductase [Candidatus Korobacteraceae bacterium]